MKFFLFKILAFSKNDRNYVGKAWTHWGCFVKRRNLWEMIKSIMSSDEKVSISDSTRGNTYLVNYNTPTN